MTERFTSSSVPVRASGAQVIAAARCIRHWHDALNGEGMVVSASHVRELWAALADYDAAVRASGELQIDFNELRDEMARAAINLVLANSFKGAVHRWADLDIDLFMEDVRRAAHHACNVLRIIELASASPSDDRSPTAAGAEGVTRDTR